MYEYKAEVVRVVDADTVIVDIDLGFEVWVRNIILRLDRIDAYETRLTKDTTPEMKALGLEGKAWLKETINLHRQVGEVIVTTRDKGKYGRWIAEVSVAGINISDALVSRGYAVFKSY